MLSQQQQQQKPTINDDNVMQHWCLQRRRRALALMIITNQQKVQMNFVLHLSNKMLKMAMQKRRWWANNSNNKSRQSTTTTRCDINAHQGAGEHWCRWQLPTNKRFQWILFCACGTKHWNRQCKKQAVEPTETTKPDNQREWCNATLMLAKLEPHVVSVINECQPKKHHKQQHRRNCCLIFCH